MAFKVTAERDYYGDAIDLRIVYTTPGDVPGTAHSVTFSKDAGLCYLEVQEREEIPVALKLPEELALGISGALQDFYAPEASAVLESFGESCNQEHVHYLQELINKLVDKLETCDTFEGMYNKLRDRMIKEARMG